MSKQSLIIKNFLYKSVLIVKEIIFLFSSKGPKFYEETAVGEISPNIKKLIFRNKIENLKLIEKNYKNNKILIKK